jgi:glutamate--cysteine ligase
VRDAKEIDALLDRLPQNPDSDDKAAFGPASSQILVQEGIPATEHIDGAQAEPVIHTIDRYVVGGYYRVRTAQQAGDDMRYVPLAFPGGAQPPRPARQAHDDAATPNRFYLYGVIGRLALVAASYELEATDPQMLTLDQDS